MRLRGGSIFYLTWYITVKAKRIWFPYLCNLLATILYHHELIVNCDGAVESAHVLEDSPLRDITEGWYRQGVLPPKGMGIPRIQKKFQS